MNYVRKCTWTSIIQNRIYEFRNRLRGNKCVRASLIRIKRERYCVRSPAPQSCGKRARPRLVSYLRIFG